MLATFGWLFCFRINRAMLGASHRNALFAAAKKAMGVE